MNTNINHAKKNVDHDLKHRRSGHAAEVDALWPAFPPPHYPHSVTYLGISVSFTAPELREAPHLPNRKHM